MLLELAEIFFNVITPVFALVLIGYFAGPRLGLDARTLSRYAYFLLVPSFVFNVISTAEIQSDAAIRMVSFITVVEVGCALLGLLVALLLGRSGEMQRAYALIAVFGNVGNFGLPVILFRLGEAAEVAATVYFLAIIVLGFVIGVFVASWGRSGSLGAIFSVFTTPAIVALIPALLFNWLNVIPPLMLSRVTGLLGGAMVPTMLVSLGVQLAATPRLHLSLDVLASSGVRLIGGAVLALALVDLFGLAGIERGTGIFQAAMPAAVLTSIIALEYELLPDFVTTTVLFSTLASVITLTLLLAIV